MSPTSFKRLLAVLACLATASTSASEDDFGVGNGSWGDLTVQSASPFVVNAYAPVIADAGGSTITVGSSLNFAPGNLVMLFQAQDIFPADSGDPGPFDLTPLGAGRFELARLSDVDGGTLFLASPLSSSYPALLTQVVLVPEYRTVDIHPGNVLTALPWDGATGGVLAMLVQGTLINDGEISADALGFRGGQPVNNPGCDGPSGLDADGGGTRIAGGKGEGVIARRYGSLFEARGNVVNAAGGGDACNAGGGGGGNGSLGGRGGWAADSTDDVGGFGGAALTYSALDRMTFGGGGGAGDENQLEGGAGGSGGGIVFLRALELQGSGVISANGARGIDAGSDVPSDAAGGGGAGGTLYLRIAREAQCGALFANGGDGGDTPEFETTGGPCGTGGGGAAGRVLLQAMDASTCPIEALSGIGGIQPDPGWPPFFGSTPDGGEPALPGAVTVIGTGFDAGLLSSDAGGDAGDDGGSHNPRRTVTVGCDCGSTGAGLALIALGIAALALRPRRQASLDTTDQPAR